MQKKYYISFLVLILFLTTGIRGEAFVPQTPHLLYLVVSKIRVPDGMTIVQTRKIAAAAESESLDPTVSGEAVTETLTSDELTIGETLTYLFPKAVRSDLRGGAGHQFYVATGTGFVKVLNKEVIRVDRSLDEYYTDPLLYRDHEIFMTVLADAGINVDKVGLQRFEGNICWFIGEPSFEGDANPGLWIDKDDFFPVRYLIQKAGRTMDIRYENWQRISRTWYPRNTRIFVDGDLFVQIDVERMSLASGFSRDLFAIEKILNRYPEKTKVAPESTGRGAVDDLKEIETFNKLYD